MSCSTDQSPVMDDFEILRRVESLAGKNAKVVDCEKKSSFVSEETLMVNGIPIKLEGKTGERIKSALKSGQPPPVELLSEILMQAGIEKNPVQLETTMTVKSSTKTSELSTLRDRRGNLVDEKLKEFEEDDEIQTASVEIWEKDSNEAEKLRKTINDFKKSVEPLFIIPKPLPRTHTPPKTPTSPQSPPNHNGFYQNVNNNNPNLPPKSPRSPQNSQNSSIRTPIYTNTFTTSQHSNSTSTTTSSRNSPSSVPSSPNSIQRPSVPPPRIPPLMTPLKLSNNLNRNQNKPVPPPKPNKAKLQQMYSSNSTLSSASSSTESLRMNKEKPFELPVRVVYETFI